MRLNPPLEMPKNCRRRRKMPQAAKMMKSPMMALMIFSLAVSSAPLSPPEEIQFSPPIRSWMKAQMVAAVSRSPTKPEIKVPSIDGASAGPLPVIPVSTGLPIGGIVGIS